MAREFYLKISKVSIFSLSGILSIQVEIGVTT